MSSGATNDAGSAPLPLFHDSPMPLHTHRHCKNCLEMARCEGKKLFKCTACHINNYCCKACQKEHWPSHKLECKQLSQMRTEVTSMTNNPQAWIDFTNWLEYHHTSLINSTVASMDLPKNPGADEYTILLIQIHYCNAPGDPMPRRFCLKSAVPVDIRTHPIGQTFGFGKDRKERAFHVEMGRMQLEDDYGGTGRYLLLADFGATQIPFTKAFAIDKWAARAKPNPNWGMLLMEHFIQGKRVHFCCGKLEDGGCCCGGWTHADYKENFEKIHNA